MTHFTQLRIHGTLALSLITCAILYTGIVCNRVKSKVTPPTLTSSTTKKESHQNPLSDTEQATIDNALEKAIMYAHEVGTWLEDLFDTENNISYSEHIKSLKKTLINIKQDFVMPLTPDENTHHTIKTTHQLGLLLLEKVENTYAVLKSYRNSNYPFVHIGLGMALKKVLTSPHNQAEFDIVLKELHAQLEAEAPLLNTKLDNFKKVIKLYNERINNRNWRTLTNGLWHRLACKEKETK